MLTKKVAGRIEPLMKKYQQNSDVTIPSSIVFQSQPEIIYSDSNTLVTLA